MDNMYNDFKSSLNKLEEEINSEKNKTLNDELIQSNQTDKIILSKTIDNLKTEIKSTLSPTAPSFVPRYPLPVVHQQPLNYLPENDLNEEFSNKIYNDFSKYDALKEFKKFVDDISKSPAFYDFNINEMTFILNDWVGKDQDLALEWIVNIIMEQVFLDSNFCYNGVRLCTHLDENLSTNTCKTFRDYLLQRCKREHSKRFMYKESCDNGFQIRSLTFFFGELCTKLKIDDLTLQLADFLKILISQKSPENIKCCCKVLKLCGKYLSEFLEEKNSSNIIEEIFEQLESSLHNVESESLLELVRNTIELYKNKWVLPQSTLASNNSYTNNEFSKKNSQVSFNYDFGPCGDDLNDDVCDAFEEFLKSSGQLG